MTQERRGVLDVEEYYQTLIDPQALQLDTRLEDLNLLYFSDYGTGYIYSVSAQGGRGGRGSKWMTLFCTKKNESSNKPSPSDFVVSIPRAEQPRKT